MDDRIQTLNPDPTKRGVRISLERYERLKATILDVLAEQGPLSYLDLQNEVVKRLTGTMEGSIQWYMISVKLDLEARGILVHERNQKNRSSGCPGKASGHKL